MKRFDPVEYGPCMREVEDGEYVEHEEIEKQLNRFAQYLNEHCDVQVQNMVRPFMDSDA